MTIVRCPRCRDEVTVPAKATGRALVRCPLCLEEYLLAEALANAPPSLVIIGGEVEQSMLQTTGSEGDEYQLAAGPLTPNAVRSSTAAMAETLATRPALRTARPRRKEKSGLVLLVNYVVGGVMGIVLGLLVLWWWIGQDPLNVGPPIAAYAPWIVPQQFHGKADNGDAPSLDARPAEKKSASKKPAAVAPPQPSSTELQTLPAARRGGGGAPRTSQPSSTELQTLPGLDEPKSLPDLTPNPLIDAPKLDERGEAKRPPMPDLTSLLPDGPFVVQSSSESERPQATAGDLAQAVDVANAAFAKYEKIPKEDSEHARQAFVELYEAAGEVGRTMSYLNPADPQLADSVARVQELLGALSGANGVSRLRPIKFLTARWWPEHPVGQGLLAAGTVKAFESRGSLFDVTLQTGASDSPLSVPLVTAKNPRDLCKVGDELVVLGRVVEQPKESLPGYDGDEPRVLLVGYAVRVPKAD
jgi:hypothetical protein